MKRGNFLKQSTGAVVDHNEVMIRLVVEEVLGQAFWLRITTTGECRLSCAGKISYHLGGSATFRAEGHEFP